MLSAYEEDQEAIFIPGLCRGNDGFLKQSSRAEAVMRTVAESVRAVFS